VTGIEDSQEGAIDWKAFDENAIEIVVDDALHVACDYYFIHAIFLIRIFI